ncbi:MAG: family 20 glycosylhydrolase [Verrucomicrobiota bacterium]
MTPPNHGPFDRPAPGALRTQRHAWLTAAMAMLLVTATSGSAAPSAIQVIPLPRVIRPAAGTFALTPQTAIFVNSPELTDVGRYLAEMLAPATGMQLAVGPLPAAATRGIVLALDKDRGDLGQEGYALICTPEALTLTAARPAGVFYAVQTLRQLLPIQIESQQPVANITWTVPCVAIEDQPRFPWRGYLLDPARHFRTKGEIKDMIDLLAMQKLNVMQLHLTDDQGWRVEIKKYPKLTEIGARLANCSGKKGDSWFYRQDDIRELVAYAASRYVTLVPEIEMPGHSGAATTAYPELACGGTPSSALCVAQEHTFEFASAVLDEVLALFPSPYIHIGADEVTPARWRTCPQCKPLMDKLAQTALPADVTPFRLPPNAATGVPFQADIARLQGEFVRRIDRYLTSKGRRMIGWDEIMEGGLQADSRALAMAWRGAQAVLGAAGQRHDVIVALHPDLYLDNATRLEQTYAFEPVPADMPPGQEAHVLGLQGNMWGEGTPTIQRVEQQSFPRLCAIAETGWTARSNRNFPNFVSRLVPFKARLKVMGVTGATTGASWPVATVQAPPPPQKLPLWAGQAPMGDGTFEAADAPITVHLPDPAKANGAAIVLCAGGGYGGLVIDAEGHNIAKWLNQHGIAGIVLEYRLPKGRPVIPLLDAQRAIRTVRANANKWNLNPDRIGIMGFSAGGHLAAMAGTRFDAGHPEATDPLERLSCRPDFVMLVYPVITMGEKTSLGTRVNLLGPDPTPEMIEQFSAEKQVSTRTPPMFITHSKLDSGVSVENSRMLSEALKAHQVPVEYMELATGNHTLNALWGGLWDSIRTRMLAWLGAQNMIPATDAAGPVAPSK